MEPRIKTEQVAPEALKAMLGLEDYVRNSGLEHALLELAKMRASQLNGCAYCLDMHTKDARAIGETEQRLHAVAVWEETPFFTPRERAALAYTEVVTRVAETHVPAEAYDAAAQHFSPDEMGALTSLIVMINAWNMLAVATRAWAPGSYEA
jgi:AhpD family alkylhydroperoxidase